MGFVHFYVVGFCPVVFCLVGFCPKGFCPVGFCPVSLHLVLGLPCRLVHSRGVHALTLIVVVQCVPPIHVLPSL